MTRNLTLHAIVAVILVALTACSSSKAAEEATAREKQLSEMKANVEILQLEVNILTERISDLESRPYYDTASFGPSDKGYQRLDTTAGTFLVSLVSIAAYADGHRAVFKIGNPSAQLSLVSNSK